MFYNLYVTSIIKSKLTPRKETLKQIILLSKSISTIDEMNING